MPSLITGDHWAQLSASFSSGSIIGDAPAKGIPVFRADDNLERISTLSIDGATLLSDRLQTGFSIPFTRRSVEYGSLNNAHSDLGDVRWNMAFEAFPQFTYSSWKPTGYVFFQANLPTSKSIYESTEPGLVDANGKGFFSFSTGTFWKKQFSVWDLYFSPEVHYSIPGIFQSADGSLLKVSPGWGASAALGIAASPGNGDLRLGLRISPGYEQGKRTDKNVSISIGSYKLAWDTALETAYLLNTVWSVSATYTDQTLIGPAVNTTLNRMIALSLQHRWER